MTAAPFTPRLLGLIQRNKTSDALQGTLDLLVLTTLARGPMHGYAIATHIQSVSDEGLRVEEGSLYPALHRMEQSRWIAAQWTVNGNNRRARVYRLTAAGHQRLMEEQHKWNSLTKAVGKVLRFASAAFLLLVVLSANPPYTGVGNVATFLSIP